MGLPTDNAPLEGRSSLGQLIDRINREIDRLQRDVHELSARVDSAFPGADVHRHHDDHTQIREAEIDRKHLMRTLKTQAVWGVIGAVAAAVAMLAWYAFNAYLHGVIPK